MKMDRISLLTAAVAAVFACSCAGRRGTNTPSAEEFPRMTIPGMLTGPEERLSWYSLHFWDGFTDPDRKGLCDSLHVSGVPRDEVEEQFGLFATLLSGVDPLTASAAMVRLYDRTAACEQRDPASNVFETLAEFSAKYFFDPNSPVRSEEIYLPFVERLAESPFVSPGMRGAYAFDASVCRLNRPGTPAADFRFTDLRGRTQTLYGIKAPYTLLFFSNPGCEVCRAVIEDLEAAERVTELIGRGIVAVVNVYIDEDLDAWREYAVTYPAAWHSGYDPDYAIRTDLLYAVRAIPSLYLLDSDKTVLFKDARPEQVLEYLGQLQ